MPTKPDQLSERLEGYEAPYRGSAIDPTRRPYTDADIDANHYGRLSIDDKRIERAASVCRSESLGGIVQKALAVLQSGKTGAIIVTAQTRPKVAGLTDDKIPLLVIEYSHDQGCRVHPVFLPESELFALEPNGRLSLYVEVKVTKNFNSRLIQELVDTVTKTAAAGASLGVIPVGSRVVKLGGAPIAALADKADVLVGTALSDASTEDSFTLNLSPQDGLAKDLEISRGRSELGIGLLRQRSAYGDRDDLQRGLDALKVSDLSGKQVSLPELFHNSDELVTPAKFRADAIPTPDLGNEQQIGEACRDAKNYLHVSTFLNEQDIALSLYLLLARDGFFSRAGTLTLDQREAACFGSSELMNMANTKGFDHVRGDAAGERTRISFVNSPEGLVDQARGALLELSRTQGDTFTDTGQTKLAQGFSALVEDPGLITHLPESQDDREQADIEELKRRLAKGAAFEADASTARLLRGLALLIGGAPGLQCIYSRNQHDWRGANEQQLAVYFSKQFGTEIARPSVVSSSDGRALLPVLVGGRYVQTWGQPERFELTRLIVSDVERLRREMGFDTYAVPWPDLAQSSCKSISIRGHLISKGLPPRAESTIRGGARKLSPPPTGGSAGHADRSGD